MALFCRILASGGPYGEDYGCRFGAGMVGAVGAAPDLGWGCGVWGVWRLWGPPVCVSGCVWGCVGSVATGLLGLGRQSP